jgi:hypothetical protein
MSCGAGYCPGARTFIPAPVRPPSGLPITIAAYNRSSPCADRNLHSFGRFLTTGTNLACCFEIADAVNRLFLSQGGTRRSRLSEPVSQAMGPPRGEKLRFPAFLPLLRPSRRRPCPRPKDVYELVMIGGGPFGLTGR